MSKRIALFGLCCLIMAALFTRLGFWQVSRLHQRQAENQYIGSRMDSSAVPFFSLTQDSAKIRYRRVAVNGTPDFAHEFYLVDRSRSGTPGVWILTPIRVPGHDTAVLVNRGWVYSADASTVDPSQWHAPDTTFVGYVNEFQEPTRAPPEPRHLRTIYYPAVASALPYPLATSYVVALGSDSVIAGVPLRISPPPMDEGPHRGYAIQWFSFSLIAIGGGLFIILKDREKRAAARKGDSPQAGA